MAKQTVNIPLEDDFIIQGDTIPKITFAFAAEDDIDLTGATIKMQVYNKSTAFIDITNSTGITLVDSKTFEIDEVSAANNTFAVGSWTGDLEITLADGTRKTFFRVKYNIDTQYTI